MRTEGNIKAAENSSLKQNIKLLEGEIKNLKYIEVEARKKTQNLGEFELEVQRKEE